MNFGQMAWNSTALITALTFTILKQFTPSSHPPFITVATESISVRYLINTETLISSIHVAHKNPGNKFFKGHLLPTKIVRQYEHNSS